MIFYGTKAGHEFELNFKLYISFNLQILYILSFIFDDLLVCFSLSS